jgi:hypothetical protein
MTNINSHKTLLYFTTKILFIALLTSCSKVNEVKINHSLSDLKKGASTSLDAQILGEYNPDTTVIWSIESNTDSGTVINDKGVITIKSNERADSITIKATSKQDSTKFDLIKLDLLLSKEAFFGVWKEPRQKGKLTIEENEWTIADVVKFVDLKWTPVLNNDPKNKDKFTEGYQVTGNFKSLKKSKETLMGTFQILMGSDENTFFITTSLGTESAVMHRVK